MTFFVCTCVPKFIVFLLFPNKQLFPRGLRLISKSGQTAPMRQLQRPGFKHSKCLVESWTERAGILTLMTASAIPSAPAEQHSEAGSLQQREVCAMTQTGSHFLFALLKVQPEAQVPRKSTDPSVPASPPARTPLPSHRDPPAARRVVAARGRRRPGWRRPRRSRCPQSHSLAAPRRPRPGLPRQRPPPRSLARGHRAHRRERRMDPTQP